MQFVLTLKELWSRRVCVVSGVLAALLLSIVIVFKVGSGFPPLKSKQQTVWTSSAQVLIDAHTSAVGDLNQGLDPLIPRATVYGNLMTSAALVQLIGQASHIPANEITVNGPFGTNGHRPAYGATVLFNGAVRYSLLLDTDATQPIIRITAGAPTSDTARALANGAAIGLETYVTQFEATQQVPARRQVDVRELGGATVTPASSGIAPPFVVPIFIVLAGLWCMLVLMTARFGEVWRRGEERGLFPPAWADADAAWADAGHSTPSADPRAGPAMFENDPEEGRATGEPAMAAREAQSVASFSNGHALDSDSGAEDFKSAFDRQGSPPPPRFWCERGDSRRLVGALDDGSALVKTDAVDQLPQPRAHEDVRGRFELD